MKNHSESEISSGLYNIKLEHSLEIKITVMFIELRQTK